jgi:hypothetical protein
MTKRNLVKEGERHSHLTATGISIKDIKYKNVFYEWICDCGTKTFKRTVVVRSKQAKTCGQNECYYRQQTKRKVFPGFKFNHLTVTGNHKNGSNGRKGKSEFKCDCGNIIWAYLRNVKKGRKNCSRAGCPYNPQLINGYSTIYKKEYRAWLGMKSRCLDQNNMAYHNYGGRGVSISKELETFEGFFKCVGKAPSPTHTLDRINNDGNYETGNLKWSTYKEQANNRRKCKHIEKKREIIRQDLLLFPSDKAKDRSKRLNINLPVLYDHIRKIKVEEIYQPVKITEI